MKKAILIIVAVPVVAWVLLWIVAASMERSVASRPWPGGLEGLDKVAARYPERNAETSAALALTRLTVPLGVDIAPRADRRFTPASPARKEYDAIKKPLHDYIDAQLVRPSNAIDDAPPALAAYLADHRAQLDGVRAHLLSGAPIAWKMQLSKGFDAPIPNLLGHLELTRLFLADALLKTRGGDAAAWDDLHAIWLLDGGLRPRPDLISQLISLAMGRMTNAAAAKMPLPEPAWLGVLRAADYRHSLMASMQSEAWGWMHLPHYGGRLASPYIRLCGADIAEHVRVAFVNLAKSNACGVGDTLSQDVNDALPRWNVLGRIAVPNIASTWQRASRTIPETELTEKVLQLRRGETPSPFSRCSDGRWLVTASSVKFSRTLRGPKTGLNYPLEYAALDLGH
jgi:hypothetical protein